MKVHPNLIIAIIVGLLLLPISISGCQSLPVPGTVSPDGANVTSQVPRNFAEFDVGPITVNRSGVSVGEIATVSTTIKNTGGIQGTYTAVFTVDGKQVDKKDVPVGFGSAETVSFTISKEAPGSYKLEIGDRTATLNVYQWPYRIQYDLGNAYGELLTIAGDYGHIVHFTPPTTPFKIQKIEVYTQGLVSKDSEWYDRFATIRIWNSSRTQPLWSENYIYRDFWNDVGSFWKEIDVPNVVANGDFYIEIVTHSPQFQGEMVAWPWGSEVRPAIFVGYDLPTLYQSSGVSSAETRSGISLMGQPVEVPAKYEGLDWLIRVDGDGSL
jgi:hypothetical protein